MLVMKKTALALPLILVLSFSTVAGTIFIEVGKVNPVPYPTKPNQESPTLKVESPYNE